MIYDENLVHISTFLIQFTLHYLEMYIFVTISILLFQDLSGAPLIYGRDGGREWDLRGQR